MTGKRVLFLSLRPELRDGAGQGGLLPTTDKYRGDGRHGNHWYNFDIGTAGVIAWMKELEQEQTVRADRIGFDYWEAISLPP
jgi:hypothetical protein